jgi:hypothetical protein
VGSSQRQQEHAGGCAEKLLVRLLTH